MKIRASALPAYGDCARRSAARLFPGLLKSAGFILRETLPSIGASVGTATHSVAEKYFRARLAGETFDESGAVDAAMAELTEEVAPGAEFDDSTPSVDTARMQVERMARAYIQGVAKDVEPLAVELALQADVGDGYILTGRVDLVARARDGVAIRDLKTGAVTRSHHAQLGAYSLLYRSAPPPGMPADVSEAAIDFIKRVPKTRAQTEPVSTPYDPALCERTAFATLDRIKRDVTAFKATGDPESFAANAMSMMCGEKFCPAFGTDFCPVTKPFSQPS